MKTAGSLILSAGETLDRYRVLDVIGIGGMAIVYRAEHVSLGREVALKVLAPALTDDAEFRRRFRREGQSIVSLQHPNVVAIYDSGEAKGRLFLAMRLINGMTLAERMRAQRLSADEAVAVLGPIADALDTAHCAGIVHRDVKPQNILIGVDGRPYLADFGVAKELMTAGFTQTGGFVGSYNYASPEQILGEPITPAVDIYGLTAVLYQCLTGHAPYLRDTDAGVLHAHVNEPPPAIPPDRPGAEAFNAIIARGMAKRPTGRYERAQDLIAATAAVVNASPAVGLMLSSGGTATARVTRASGLLRLSYATPWRAAEGTVAGSFALAGKAIQLSTSTGTVAAGLLARSAKVPGGAPPALVSRYGLPTTSANDTVAGHPGRVYAWQGSRLVVFVIPMRSGDAALICQQDVTSTAAQRACKRLSSAASVPSVDVLEAGPDLVLGSMITRTLGPVTMRRAKLHGLGGSSLRGRAAIAAALGHAEEKAARIIAHVPAPDRYVAAIDRLGTALQGEARAYGPQHGRCRRKEASVRHRRSPHRTRRQHPRHGEQLSRWLRLGDAQAQRASLAGPARSDSTVHQCRALAADADRRLTAKRRASASASTYPDAIGALTEHA